MNMLARRAAPGALLRQYPKASFDISHRSHHYQHQTGSLHDLGPIRLTPDRRARIEAIIEHLLTCLDLADGDSEAEYDQDDRCNAHDDDFDHHFHDGLGSEDDAEDSDDDIGLGGS